MTTPHDKAIQFAARAIAFEANKDELPEGGWNEYCLSCAHAAISAYLSSIGGVVCAREPAAYLYHHPAYEDRPSKRPLSGKDIAAGFTASPLHAPIPEAGNGDGWSHDMDAAPKDKTPVIIAVPHKDNDGYIVGEAYFDPEHYGDGDWWWAGTSHGDYHSGPISEINYHWPSAWRPLPSPPTIRSNDTGREG